MKLSLNIKSFGTYILILVYGIYSGLNFSLGFSIPGINYLFFLIILSSLITCFYWGSVLQQIKALIAFSFIGIDTVLFLSFFLVIPPLIYILSEKKKIKIKLPVLLFIFFAIYILFISIIGNLIDPFLPSFIMGLATYGSPIILFIYFSLFTYSKEKLFEVLNFFRNLIICQLVLVTIQFFIEGTYWPGDYGTGSFGNTGKSGFYITLLLVYEFLVPIFFGKVKVGSIIKKLFFFIFILIALIFIDAKLIYLSILIALIFCFLGFLFVRLLKNRLPVKVMLFLGGGLIFLTVFFPVFFRLYLKNFLNEVLDVNKIVHMYTENPEYAQKSIFYKNVFKTMPSEYPITYLFGTGIGKLGSRASNTFASDILYKDPSTKLPSFIPVYSSPWTKAYMKGLYTKEIYDNMKWRSANLSFPFAGIASIKGEFGLIGLILFIVSILLICITLIKRSYRMEKQLKDWGLTFAVFGYSFILVLFFDNYQEMPQITFPFFIISSMYLCTKDQGESIR
ncbi:MAG TPA: hypothetical protein VD908_17220 [Cytophagales bacterium]|nr:hypothetical protein [Cytophagales bacterium]